MIYWLQTFRSECVNRMEKALEIDKDVSYYNDVCLPYESIFFQTRHYYETLFNNYNHISTNNINRRKDA